jgi:hypothetical protein
VRACVQLNRQLLWAEQRESLRSQELREQFEMCRVQVRLVYSVGISESFCVVFLPQLHRPAYSMCPCRIVSAYAVPCESCGLLPQYRYVIIALALR